MTTHHRLVACTVMTVSLTACISVTGCDAKDEPNKSRAGKENKKKVRAEPLQGEQIPLESVHFMEGNIRKGPKWELVRTDEDIAEELRKIYLGSAEKGPSLFLVSGDNVAAAIEATRRFFTTDVTMDVPITPEKPLKDSSLWLVAYFGQAQSHPRVWTVRSVVKAKEKVQLVFQRADTSLGGTKDSRPYIFWVPLGKLDPGPYTLQAFDIEAKQVTMSQPVTIAKASR